MNFIYNAGDVSLWLMRILKRLHMIKTNGVICSSQFAVWVDIEPGKQLGCSVHRDSST